ncbi:MAG: hypothetical protein LBC85_06045 [Fibromonadaceae bacterium]|jgi:hypothetical protein|nr:hypothetical protein [Fibromonadaceae bacterium]
MKKVPKMRKFLFFAIALLALLFVSCLEGVEANCSLERPELACDVISGKIYAGSGKIYMTMDGYYLNQSQPISTERALEVGTIKNGKITFTLPENVDSHFLKPAGIYAEPSDVEVWLYKRQLRLVNNKGMYVGDLINRAGIDENEYHRILYWYFSEDVKINQFYYNLETETFDICAYDIDAKKGWNKVHLYEILREIPCYTTDLSKVPDNSIWLLNPPGS